MAVRFDVGTDNLSRTTTLPSITAFTLMCWAYLVTDSGGMTQCPLSFGSSSGGNFYEVGFGQSSGLKLSIYNVLGIFFGPTLTLATWTHIALTCAGTGTNQLIAYANGTAGITNDGSTAPTAGTLMLGTS